MSASSGQLPGDGLALATAGALRLLKYVVDLSSAGYRPTTSEFDAYADQPDQGMKFGAVLAAVLGSSWMRGEPVETKRAYLSRLRWVTEEGGRLVATELGRALLRSQTQIGLGDRAVLVLEPGNPFSYAELAARFAESGEALLVEPYLGVQHLMDIASYTEVTRVLIGDQSQHRKGLRAAGEKLELNRSLEIRVSSELHDRYFVPKVGLVDMLGTSMSGVGKKLTVLAPLDEAASNVIRKLVEGMWKRATPLAEAKVTEASV